jgi:two-component system sensor histidine kinase/response regulator
MDVMMPVMDGIEATRLFRASETGLRTPIIAMTANAMASDRDACVAAGMDAFISKPIKPEELQTLLQRHGRQGHAETLASAGFEAIDTDQADDQIDEHLADFDYDCGLAAADAEMVDIISDTFIEQWPLDLQKMSQGLSSQDLAIVGRVSHALKGTLAMFGAAPASDLARQIEADAENGLAEGLRKKIALLAGEVKQLLLALQRAKP